MLNNRLHMICILLNKTMEISPKPSAPALSPANTPNSVNSVTSLSTITLLNQLLDEIYDYNENQQFGSDKSTRFEHCTTDDGESRQKFLLHSIKSALASPNQSTSENSNKIRTTSTTSPYFGSSTCTQMRVFSQNEYTQETLMKKSNLIFYIDI